MKPHAVMFSLLCAVMLPLTAGAAADAQREYQEALHSRPNLDRGAELFRTCLACHGPAGGGTPDGGAPRIAGQHYSVIIGQLVDYRHDKRWDPRMEHFADTHHLVNAQAIADVAGYVSQLQSLPDAQIGVGPGESLTLGGQIYQMVCASCHGREGEGSEPRRIPQIAGQHYEYLRRQIYDAVDGRRPNFSRAHIRLLATLEHSDIAAVADYLSRIHRQPAPLPSLATAAAVGMATK